MPKFNSFYYSEDNQTHSLSDLEELSDRADGDMIYLEKYDGKMFCPECQTPLLCRLRRKGKVYLKANPKQKHKEIDGVACNYAHEIASVRAIKKYVAKLDNDGKIPDVLNSVMLLLHRNQSKKVSKTSKISANQLLTVSKSKSKKSISKQKILPRFSFKRWGLKTPQNILLVAYGKVYIQTYIPDKENDGSSLTSDIKYWWFRSEEKGELYTSMRIPDKYKALSDGFYNVVILGQCVLYNSNNRTYYNLKPYNGDSILIE